MKYQTAYILLVSLLLSLSNCVAQKPQTTTDKAFLSPKLLNSERTQLKFGSYGITVPENGINLRVANLYSMHGNKKITRTFAVVRYPAKVNKAFAAVHARIVKGSSMGKTFKQNGWSIIKKKRYFGEIAANADYKKVYALMGNIKPARLAVYFYEFTIQKNGQSFRYATIAEVYHPDYLRLKTLKKIYHDFGNYTKKTPATSKMLEVVERKMK